MKRAFAVLAAFIATFLLAPQPAVANNGVWNISHVCKSVTNTVGWGFVACLDQKMYLTPTGYELKTEAEYFCQFGGQTVQCDTVIGWANEYISTYGWMAYHKFVCSGNCSTDRNFDHYIPAAIIGFYSGCYQWQGHISNASGYIDGYKLDVSAFYGANNKICD